MLQKLLTAFFLSTVLLAVGQDEQPIIEVDYKAIEQSINDPATPLYYPRLMERFENNDTTLSLLEYYYLYYGHSFQEQYNSLLRIENERLTEILRKESLEQSDYQEIATIYKDWLRQRPFELEGLYYLLVSLDKTGQNAEAELVSKKLNGLIDAIIATGDGLSVETAFHVISVDDEYFLLDIFNLSYAGKQELIETCDYLHVQPNDSDVEGLYFNVERHFAYMSKVFGGGGKD